MKRFLFACLLLIATVAHGAPAPVTVIVSQQPTASVRIDDGSSPAVSIRIPNSDVLSIVTAGPQGIPGPPGATGTQGSAGATGPAGPQGAAGAPGPAGADGTAGPNLITTGTVTPLSGLLKGNGSNVATATPGTDYLVTQVNSDWSASSGAAKILNKPAIPQACVDVYDGVPGPTGAAGAAGPAGANGASGANGKTVLNGYGAPSNGIGVDGDFFLDTQNAHLYGPKTSGVWGGYIDLVGPQGPQGLPGASASITQTAVLGVLDDATDGSVLWVQQGATEQATDAKMGVKDRPGNAKQWVDSNGTMVRQCITADSAPAFKVLSSGGAVIYSVACDNTMTFTGAVTIK
jgi:hypothetical protein